MLINIVTRYIENLPPLPSTIQEVERVYANKHSNFKHLADVIAKDPMLTANLLKKVNLPVYGFSKEIANMDQAIALFGFGTIRGLVISCLIEKEFDIHLRAYNIKLDDISKSSNKRNALLMDWLGKSDNAQLMSTAIFLMDLGKLVINEYLKAYKKQDKFIKIIAEYGEEEAELEFIGTTASYVSYYMFNKWNFESNLLNLLKYVDDFENAPENIREMCAMIWIAKKAIKLNSTVDTDYMFMMNKVAKKYGINFEKFRTCLNRFVN